MLITLKVVLLSGCVYAQITLSSEMFLIGQPWLVGVSSVFIINPLFFTLFDPVIIRKTNKSSTFHFAAIAETLENFLCFKKSCYRQNALGKC